MLQGLGDIKHNISVVDLLGTIPDSLLCKLALRTNVDHQVKKLYGRNLFCLLLYGYLESTKVSQRTLEDVYNSRKFKFLFNIDQGETIKYNTISDRLAAVNVDYFKEMYEHTYTLFSKRYGETEAEGHLIVRVDSTMVGEAANKLKEGVTMGNQYSTKKHVKFTVSMAGLFPSGAEICTLQEHSNENKIIPQAIINHEDKSGNLY